jgi:Double zinc ribbon
VEQLASLPTMRAADVLLLGEATAALSACALFLTWLAAVLWVTADVRTRTTTVPLQCLSIAAAVIFFLPGLMLYLAVRPRRTIEEEIERRWEMEALALEIGASPACHCCGRRVQPDFLSCPYCGASLGEECPGCGRFNKAAWVSCPYCARRRVADVGMLEYTGEDSAVAAVPLAVRAVEVRAVEAR